MKTLLLAIAVTSITISTCFATNIETKILENIDNFSADTFCEGEFDYFFDNITKSILTYRTIIYNYEKESFSYFSNSCKITIPNIISQNSMEIIYEQVSECMIKAEEQIESYTKIPMENEWDY